MQYFERNKKLIEERFQLQQDTLYYVKSITIDQKTHVQTFSKALSIHQKAHIYKTLYTPKALENIKIKKQLGSRASYTLAQASIQTNRRFEYDIQMAQAPENIQSIRPLRESLLHIVQQ
ncbi:hypothetical protein FHS56_002028 [Thermonema lapsum]|uniref:Uncharacterized protein n=1 Tax=Thermonema lapsum TaxID=28195 RepID=A0A846MSH4_9BACT|nr:hypothetical protein [Thermonema lapsum]NIK74503.1 hypothetical protein [Thermonema lapsum]